jgi:hypothetical protein
MYVQNGSAITIQNTWKEHSYFIRSEMGFTQRNTFTHTLFLHVQYREVDLLV